MSATTDKLLGEAGLSTELPLLYRSDDPAVVMIAHVARELNSADSKYIEALESLTGSARAETIAVKQGHDTHWMGAQFLADLMLIRHRRNLMREQLVTAISVWKEQG